MEEFKNCGEVEEKILELEEQEPPKGTIEHNNWEEKMNNLFAIYNQFANFVAYKKIK